MKFKSTTTYFYEAELLFTTQICTDNSQADSFGFIQTMPMSSNIPSGTMAWRMSFSNRDHSCCQPFLWPY